MPVERRCCAAGRRVGGWRLAAALEVVHHVPHQPEADDGCHDLFDAALLLLRWLRAAAVQEERRDTWAAVHTTCG
jgi:predicted RNA-binding Zn ribbon-like protein